MAQRRTSAAIRLSPELLNEVLRSAHVLCVAVIATVVVMLLISVLAIVAAGAIAVTIAVAV